MKTLLCAAFVMASSAFASTSKDVLRMDPLFAGSLIKYCELDQPKKCRTVDRRKEKALDADRAAQIKEVTGLTANIFADFSFLSVKNDELDFSLSYKVQKPRK